MENEREEIRQEDGTYLVRCNSCLEWVIDDYMGTSELAIKDVICQECIEDGYGR